MNPKREKILTELHANAKAHNESILFSFKDADAKIDNIEDPLLWIKQLYAKILNIQDISDNDKGVLDWMNSLKNGVSREKIVDFFRNEAKKKNSEMKPQQMSMDDFLDKDDEGRRVLFVIPESIGDVFICTALFKSIKELQYPDCNLYVSTKPEYFGILLDNPYIHKLIPYIPAMDSQVMLEGSGTNKSYFKISLHPYAATQRFLNYLNGGQTKLALEVKL